MNKQSNDLAFVFPGQGSQSVGMLTELADSYPEVKQTFARASDVLGKDLWAILNGNPEELNQTYNTQPIMLAAGVSVWEIWCKLSEVRPAWMAGHSLGEYTALVCSGALAFEDAISLVSTRGHLMQEAVPQGQGAMAAIIGLSDEDVIKVCQESAEGEIVSAVNFNSVGQVVIAGNTAAVQRAMQAAKAAGAKLTVPIPVSVPSHCSLMKPAADKLEQYLQSTNVNTPEITLIHNADITSHHSPVAIRTALKEQLYLPVRWVETISYLHAQGVSRFIECGPGKVLSGLNKRIAKTAEHLTMYDPETIMNAAGQFA
ncbi:ACP S-malonyltransferase [Methylosoma difficile]